MARTVGALNKRTRAALHAAQTGELGAGGENPIEHMLRVMRNSKKPDSLRLEAARSVAPFLCPKLSAVEVTNQSDDAKFTEAELLEQLKELITSHPELLAQF
jgi:hypothetical protein